MAIVWIDLPVVLVYLREARGHVAGEINNSAVLKRRLSFIVGQMVVEAGGGRSMESQGIPLDWVFATTAINSVPEFSGVQSSQRGFERAQSVQVGSVR